MDNWIKSSYYKWMKTDGLLDTTPKTSTLEITPDILAVISELDEFKGAWSAIGRLAPERLLNLRRVASIESVGSSTRIEGAKLSDREVQALLSNLEIKKFKSRDEQEVAGYAAVMQMGFESWETIDLTENHIRQLHRDLLQHTGKDQQEVAGYAAVMQMGFESWETIDLTENHIRQLHRDLLQHTGKDQRHRGAYKTLNNHVEAFGPDGESLGVIFETATPFETPQKIAALVT